MEEIMRPGIDQHTWKNSEAISVFINEAKVNVDELHQIVMKMKESLAKIN
jgi:hypothetical protein